MLTLIADFSAESDAAKNMKRESKAYSYKDQLEEIKLRKELEEKRKKEGKPLQLTPKQKEAMKVQLEKESAIRNQVKQVSMSSLGGCEFLLNPH